MNEALRERLYALDDRHPEYLWKQEHNRKVDAILAEIEAAGYVLVPMDKFPRFVEDGADLGYDLDNYVILRKAGK